MAPSHSSSFLSCAIDDSPPKPPAPYERIEDSVSNVPLQSLMSIVNGISDSSTAISDALASPISSSSSISHLSETMYRESESDDEYETDVDSDMDADTDINADDSAALSGKYAYDFCLMPALSVPMFTLGPSTMDSPWPYTFKKDTKAFAKGGNGRWRHVTLLDGGVVDADRERLGLRVLVYTAQWVGAEGQTFRASFCPTRGDIKPDDAYVRRLLAKEGIELQRGGRDVCTGASNP